MKRIFVLCITAAALLASGGPTVFYSRQQAGARPAYVQITVHRDGTGEYRESVDDPDDIPVKFHLRPNEVNEIFSLADKLDHFKNPLESNLKVANMGIKTFRYIDGDQASEQQFNFSKDANARILADYFARLTESARHFINLERAVSFDKLGVNKILLQIQVSVEKNRLAAPDQFLPLLDKVAGNESFLNMARTRAARLAQYIRSTGSSNK